jgi:Zn finger protein HypA/HybF involved in hydrogenase expression
MEGSAMNSAIYAKITLGELAKLVIETVEASCQCCGASWRTAYDFLPPSTPLVAMAGLLICPACGGRELAVAPARGGEAGPAH